MNCKKCGQVIAENWRFCHGCGEQLQVITGNTPRQVQTNVPPPKPVEKSLPGCFGRLVIFAILTWLIYIVLGFFF
jgi:ribosomal protein L34E